MTSRTTRQHFLTSDFVIGFQLQSLFVRQFRIIPLNIVNLRLRANEFFRLAVTLQTPFHLQCVFLPNGGHIVNLSVTGRAADAFGDVNAVVEIGVFGEVVNALPFNRFVLAPTGAHRFQIRAVRPDLRVAVHTGLRRRNARRIRSFDRRVAVTTINTVVAGVMLVAELNRLLLFHVLSGQVARPGELRVNETGRRRQNDRHDDAYFCDVICCSMKNLCHFIFLKFGNLRFAVS